jgi:hypothetical protein
MSDKLTLKQKAKDKRGFVYVFQATDAMFKIGRSAHWQSRLEDLATANPYKLKPAYIFECAFAVEQVLHKTFKPQRVNGEWFHLSDADIKSIPALVLQADPLAGIELSAEELIECPAKILPFRDRFDVGRDLLALWPGLLRARASGTISLFRVTVCRQSSTVKFDIQTKIKALLALAAYHCIPKEKVRAALSGRHVQMD